MNSKGTIIHYIRSEKSVFTITCFVIVVAAAAAAVAAVAGEDFQEKHPHQLAGSL